MTHPQQQPPPPDQTAELTEEQKVVRILLQRLKDSDTDAAKWHVVRDSNVFYISYGEDEGYSAEVSETRFLTEFLAFYNIKAEYE